MGHAGERQPQNWWFGNTIIYPVWPQQQEGWNYYPGLLPVVQSVYVNPLVSPAGASHGTQCKNRYLLHAGDKHMFGHNKENWCDS